MFLATRQSESAAMAVRGGRSPEALLGMLAAPSPSAGDLRAALDALPKSDTAGLLARISYHRIDGLAHRAIALLEDIVVDEWLRRSLKRRRERIAAATLSQGLALAQILEACHRSRLPVAVMRGLRSAEGIYGDPGSRPFQDHDLLIRASDRGATERLLGREGFARAAPGLYRRGGVFVDLHVDPLGASRRPTRAALFPLSTEAIFERSHAGTVAGAPALVPSTEDEILLNAIHLVKHSFDRLIRAADLAHAVVLHRQAICWETLTRRAEASRTTRLLAWAFQAVSLLGVEGPAALRPSAGRGPLESTLMNRVMALRPLPYTGDILMALAAPTLAARVRFFMDALLPAGEAPSGAVRKAVSIPRRASALLRQAAFDIGARRHAR